jgi:glycosyltransferase involved in cell wall biosynthesis
MDKRKKILFLVTQSEFGGAQRFIYTFTTALHVSANYEIVVGAGPEGDDEKGLLFALEKKGISIRHLKYLKRSIDPLFDFLGVIEICQLIKKEKPDILFLNCSKAGMLGGLAGRILRMPNIIYRIGGWTFNDPWPNWKKKMYILIEKYTAKLKDIIINNAKSDTEQAIKLGIKPRKKLVTISNGVDVNGLEFLNKERAREEIFRRLTQNQFASQNTQTNADNLHESAYPEGEDLRVSAVIGTIANFYPPKGLEYLIEAANILGRRSTQIEFAAQNTQINAEASASISVSPKADNLRVSADIKFIIIGEGEERGKLEGLIKKHNLEKTVFLTGTILNASKYLKAFDIFVLPSVKEGFPWTVLEAMSAEIPVIVTKVGAVPDIIENGENGFLLEPRDSQSIADSIEKLLGDENLRKNMAQAGKKTVIDKFSLDKMMSEYIKLFG